MTIRSLFRRHSVALLAGGLFALGLTARFLFLRYDYTPIADPSHFFSGALDLLTSGRLTEAPYFALFPFLLPYTFLLSLAMRLFGGGLLAVIALNTTIDLLNAYLFGWLFARLTRSRRQSSATFHPLAAALYFVFPVHVIFSALSLPVIIVNTFILLTLICAYLLHRHRAGRTFYALCFTTGLLLAFGQLFRPVFTVALIAFYLLFLVWTLRHRLPFRRFALGCFLILLPFLALAQLSQAAFTRFLGEPTTSSSGWSLFVGANLASNGEWSATDYAELTTLRDQGLSAPDVHAEFSHRGLARWQTLTWGERCRLFAHKALVLGFQPARNTHNLNSYPNFTHAKFLGYLLAAAAWLALVGVVLWLLRLTSLTSPVFFIALFALGLFAASLLVEVSPRYFLPLWPPLLLLSGLGYRSFFTTLLRHCHDRLPSFR
jgi:4-amino-4-deoxy-L-arabinose transferase-like glycosyltransferase